MKVRSPCISTTPELRSQSKVYRAGRPTDLREGQVRALLPTLEASELELAAVGGGVKTLHTHNHRVTE